MEKHFSAGGVLVNSKNEIYLINQIERGEWLLPKGGIEKGETETDAGMREIREETGYQDIELLNKKPIFIQHYTFVHPKTNQEIDKTVSFFLYKLLTEKHLETEEMNTEKLKGNWFEIDRAIETVSFEELKTVIRNARDILQSIE